MTGHGGGVLGEDRGHFGNRHLRFGGVIAIVEADADDLGRARNGGAQRGLVEVVSGGGARRVDVAAYAVERVGAAGDHGEQVRETCAAQADQVSAGQHRGFVMSFVLNGRKSHRNLPFFGG